MTDSLHDDADDLLHWLNAHSVSVSDGIPFTLVQQKWTLSQRPLPKLRDCLEWLFAQGLVTMTPGVEQPHIRLSAIGFQKLLTAMDNARHPAPAASLPPAPAASVRPASAEPKTVFNPAPLTPRAGTTPLVSAAPQLTEASEHAAAPRFLDPSKPPTEIGLRNQIMLIFRDLKLRPGQQLIAMTLTRYWQEMGQRGEHLRAGIDVLLRDGYIEHAVKRYENYWTLKPAGYAYITAAATSPALLALALPLREIGESHPDDDLRRKAIGMFRGNASQSFTALEGQWRYSRDALIHALDLLIKSGDLEFDAAAPLTFALTQRALKGRR